MEQDKTLGLVLQKLDIIDRKIDQLGERVDRLEERIGRLEQRVDRLEERMDRLEEKVDRLEKRVDQLSVQNQKDHKELTSMDEAILDEIERVHGILERHINDTRAHQRAYGA